ncbi:MAG: amidohydrolase [Bryobacterales bacterium]|nr:amidohydrolase [Bryobacterales bacterium]
MRALPLFLAFSLHAEQIAIHNAKAWTADPQQPFVEAIFIDNGIIQATGPNGVIRKRHTPRTQTIDAAGKFLIPGFHDAHIHFLSGSLGLANIDLTGVCTLESIQQKIAEFARAHPEKPWITGRGWEYYCFPNKRLPRKEDIDAVVKDRPVLLTAYDGHTAWANSKALERADINRATRFNGYGEIVKDPGGQPTGALKEGAIALVRKHVPPVTRQQKLDALRQGLKLAASLGITSMQNASGDEEELSLYQELARNNELTVRISFALSIPPDAPLTRADEIAALAKKHNTGLLRVRGVKLMMDGVIESFTAAMLQPYANHAGTGSPAWTQPKFEAMVARCHRNGLQVFTHAIGDRGIRLTLDAYQRAQAALPRDARHRIEHIEIIHPGDLPRFAQLNVLASMQPIHADPGTIDVWSQAIGPQRLPLSFPWRALEQAGARLVFSSDWPASISVNPIRGLHNAVNRRTTDGKPPQGWLPHQRVSLDTALRGYTANAAFASFSEKSTGRIATGMAADVAALSQDLTAIPPIEIHKTSVDWTLFAGRIIYSK